MCLRWIIAVLLWWPALALSEHAPSLRWMQGYTNTLGMSCCGLQDCIEAAVVVLALNRGNALVRIGEYEVRVPSGNVHQSPGPTGYWCFRPDVGLPLRTYIDQDGAIRAIPPERPTADNTRCVFPLPMG